MTAKREKAAWCRHYNGIFDVMGKRICCKAGVPYAPLRSRNGRNATYTCFDPASPIACPQVSRYTESELAAQDAADRDALRRWMDAIAMGICPECDTPMVQRQVGSCVWAQPCGHRLFQGQTEATP